MNFDSESIIPLDGYKLNFGPPYGLCPSGGGSRVIDQIPVVLGHSGVLTWPDGKRSMFLFWGDTGAFGKTKDPNIWSSLSQTMIGRGREQLPPW